MESKEVLVADSTLEYFFGDVSFHEECLECTVHEYHSFLSSEFDHRVDLVGCTLDDQRTNCIVIEQDFSTGNTSFSRLAWEEDLTDNPHE